MTKPTYTPSGDTLYLQWQVTGNSGQWSASNTGSAPFSPLDQWTLPKNQEITLMFSVKQPQPWPNIVFVGVRYAQDGATLRRGVKIKPGQTAPLTLTPSGKIELQPGKLVGDPIIQISKIANATDPARAWLRWYKDDQWYSQYPQHDSSERSDPDDVYNVDHTPPANDADNPWQPIADNADGNDGTIGIPNPDPPSEYTAIEGEDGTASITVSDDTASDTDHRGCAIYYGAGEGQPHGTVLADVRLTSPASEVLHIDPAPDGASDPWQCRLSLFDLADPSELDVS